MQLTVIFIYSPLPRTAEPSFVSSEMESVNSDPRKHDKIALEL